MCIWISKIGVEYINEIWCGSLGILLWSVKLHLKDIIWRTGLETEAQSSAVLKFKCGFDLEGNFPQTTLKNNILLSTSFAQNIASCEFRLIIKYWFETYEVIYTQMKIEHKWLFFSPFQTRINSRTGPGWKRPAKYIPSGTRT